MGICFFGSFREGVWRYLLINGLDESSLTLFLCQITNTNRLSRWDLRAKETEFLNMIEESQLIEILTNKLVEVAQHPDMRKEFSVSYMAGHDGLSHEIFLYKNIPPMSDMEQFFLAYHYLAELGNLMEAEYPDEKAVDEIGDKAEQWADQVQDDNSYRELSLMYHRCMYEIYSKWNDEEGMNLFRSEYQKCQESTPKKFRAQKDSFDYWYAEAEKHDWGAMIIVSLCYRYGSHVRKNVRLSELWKQLARSTYNYYNPNGQPFDEVFAEVEKEMVTDNSNESSTN